MTTKQEIKKEVNELFAIFIDKLKDITGVVKHGKMVIPEYCSGFSIYKALEQTMEEYNSDSEVEK